jgi:hypothetical protein
MSRNERQARQRKIAFDDVEIGAADAADMDTHEDFVRAGRRGIDLCGSEGPLFDRQRRCEAEDFHGGKVVHGCSIVKNSVL